MTRTPRAISCLLAGLALASASAARADVVTLADGRVLEGSITTSGTTVTIRHRLGEVRVDRSQIVKVVETEDAWDALERLRAELALGTADERYRFAVFCRDSGFADEAQRAFLAVLRVDTDHPGARGALGYVRQDGRWITVEDRNRALGLVEHEGEWLTPDDKAKRLAEAREVADARRAERDAELARARAQRDAERDEERAARRERAELYAREVVRERARQRALDSYERPGGIYSGYRGNGLLSSGYYGYAGGIALPGGGRLRVVTTPSGYGLFSPPCTVVVRRGYSAGVQGSGSYRGGNWGLNWRFGF